MTPTYWAVLASVLGTVVSVIMALILRAMASHDTIMQGVLASIKELTSITTKNGERIAALEAIISTQTPFFAELQSRVIDLLHHPEPEAAEMDSLLEKLKKLQLTVTEKARLEVLLHDLADDEPSEQQRGASALLLLMPLVVDEAKHDPIGSQMEAGKPIVPTTENLSQKPRLPGLDALIFVAATVVRAAATKAADLVKTTATKVAAKLTEPSSESDRTAAADLVIDTAKDAAVMVAQEGDAAAQLVHDAQVARADLVVVSATKAAGVVKADAEQVATDLKHDK
jgi:uncharacterized coiled-coil protein SlyX